MKVVIYVAIKYPSYKKVTINVTADKRDAIIKKLLELVNCDKIKDYMVITY